MALPSLSGVTLAVDVALAPGGQRMAIAAAGNAPFPTLGQVFAFSLSELPSGVMGSCATVQPVAGVTGQAVAVAFTPSGQLVVQTREPAAIVLPGGAGVTLSGESRGDTGHTLFHANAGAFMACASCHPEGGDDGHIWTFLPIGSRRTQNLRGSLAGTAPFHWDGDMATFTDLAHDVFGQRMSGGALAPDQVAALERWTTTLPTIPASPVREVGTVARGRALFADAACEAAAAPAGGASTRRRRSPARSPRSRGAPGRPRTGGGRAGARARRPRGRSSRASRGDRGPRASRCRAGCAPRRWRPRRLRRRRGAAG